MGPHERQSLVVPPHDALDATWEASFATLESHTPPVYEQLYLDEVTKASLKEEFFARGCTVNPDLSPRNIDVEAISAHSESLLNYKDEVLAADDLPPDIRQAYRWRINESIATQRMLLAAHAGDVNRFKRYNEFIYGAPNPLVFDGALAYLRGQASTALGSTEPVAEAAQAVREVLPDHHGSADLLFPGRQTFEAVRAQHYRPGGYYALIFAGVTLPEKGPVRPDVGQPILEAVQHNLHADDYELIGTESKTWSVNNTDRQLKHPASYSMPLKRFIGLGPGHEWSHALEAINGRRQPIRLSAHGLDRYENGNEGRAVIREQVAYDDFLAFTGLLRWQDIVRRDVAIGLGVGVGGEAPRTFSEVFKIMNAVDRLWERNKKPGNIEAADQKADNRTWDLLMRVLKGTDGQGGAYYKDIVYLQGNVACWQAAAEHPELVDHGDVGKFDVTNPRHIALLQAYGMLPAEGE